MTANTTARRPIKKTAKKIAATKVAESATNHPVYIASVPDQKYADEYMGRKIDGVRDFDIFDAAMERGRNVLIEGPTGPGKTSAALAYAADRGLRFFAVPSNIGIEPSQLFGKFIPSAEGGFVWQDGPVTDVVRHGGLLLINEINFLLDRVSTVVFGLLDKRREIVLLDHRGEVIRAHRGKGNCWCTERNCDDKRVLVMGDMNPEYEGTRPLNKAFRNRFAYQLFWDYDPAIERKLVESDSLVAMAEQFREESRGGMGAITTPVSTNMLQEFEEVYDDLGWDFAVTNFTNHFQVDERAAAAQVVTTWSDNIKADLADREERETGSDESEDPDEWGVEGVDWYYEEEED